MAPASDRGRSRTSWPSLPLLTMHWPSGARPVIDVPEMRECFAAFRIDAVDTRYTVAGGKGQEVSEIIVCGPRPDDPDWSVVGHRRDERGRLGMTTGWIS